MSRPVRILADDLTGALDAAAPFAGPDRPVRLAWDGSALTGDGSALTGDGSWTLSSESRDRPRDEAVARSLAAFAALRSVPGPAIWFKKVDSVLRGYPVAETAAMMREGGFRRCVFAPAFPEMGRTTRNGRHFVLDGGAAREVGPDDLRAAFAAEGKERVDIEDVETAEDLARLVGRIGRDADVLWAGSRGLAAALAGPSSFLPVPRIGAVILGTSHPVTRAQAGRLLGLVRPDDGSAPIDLRADRPVLVDPVPTAADAQATRRFVAEALARLEPLPSREGGAVIVSGGDTLATVLSATNAAGVAVLGEVAAGIPLGRAWGGRLDGVCLLTKSGGFGDSGLLRRLLSSAHSGKNQGEANRARPS